MKSLYIRGDFHVCPNPLSADSYSICEMNCRYCFVRATYQTYLKPLYEKGLLPTDLKELDKVLKLAFSNKESTNPIILSLREKFPVIIGRKCEPFCPSEEKYHNTEAMLNLFSDYGVKTFFEFKGKHMNLSSVIDKSTGVLISVMPAYDKYCELLEPGTLSYSQRFDLARGLKDSGLWVGITAEPILPTISEKVFDEFSLKAKEAGVNHVNFGEFRSSNPRFNQEELAKVGISLREILRSSMKNWKSIGAKFMSDIKAQGIKCSTPDWVNFGFDNDCEGCCGLSDKFEFHKFNYQHAIKILKEKGKVTFGELREFNIFGEKYEERFKEIWNASPKYYSLSDVPGVSVSGIDSEGNRIYSKKRRNRSLAEAL